METIDDLFDSLGLPQDGSEDVTKDELAILRSLRLCPPELISGIAAKVQNHLVHDSGISRGEEPLTFAQDIIRLTLIAENGGLYERGISKQTLSELLELMAKRKVQK